MNMNNSDLIEPLKPLSVTGAAAGVDNDAYNTVDTLTATAAANIAPPAQQQQPMRIEVSQ